MFCKVSASQSHNASAISEFLGNVAPKCVVHVSSCSEGPLFVDDKPPAGVGMHGLESDLLC